MVNLVSLLPIRIWPKPGVEIKLRGISEAEAVELLKDDSLRCYIKNPIALSIISKQTGIEFGKKVGRCPLPRPGVTTLSAVVEGLTNLDPEETLAEAGKDNPNLPVLRIKWVVVETVNLTEQDSGSAVEAQHGALSQSLS